MKKTSVIVSMVLSLAFVACASKQEVEVPAQEIVQTEAVTTPEPEPIATEVKAEEKAPKKKSGKKAKGAKKKSKKADA